MSFKALGALASAEELLEAAGSPDNLAAGYFMQRGATFATWIEECRWGGCWGGASRAAACRCSKEIHCTVPHAACNKIPLMWTSLARHPEGQRKLPLWSGIPDQTPYVHLWPMVQNKTIHLEHFSWQFSNVRKELVKTDKGED